jgi:hypothetical protein
MLEPAVGRLEEAPRRHSPAVLEGLAADRILPAAVGDNLVDLGEGPRDHDKN